jgi:hypothetical protein
VLPGAIKFFKAWKMKIHESVSTTRVKNSEKNFIT